MSGQGAPDAAPVDADGGVVGMGPDADTPRKEPIRVLVVDDHALFRRGLEIVLAAEEDIQVVGEAGDGAEALELARASAQDSAEELDEQDLARLG